MALSTEGCAQAHMPTRAPDVERRIQIQTATRPAEICPHKDEVALSRVPRPNSLGATCQQNRALAYTPSRRCQQTRTIARPSSLGAKKNDVGVPWPLAWQLGSQRTPGSPQDAWLSIKTTSMSAARPRGRASKRVTGQTLPKFGTRAHTCKPDRTQTMMRCWPEQILSPKRDVHPRWVSAINDLKGFDCDSHESKPTDFAQRTRHKKALKMCDTTPGTVRELEIPICPRNCRLECFLWAPPSAPRPTEGKRGRPLGSASESHLRSAHRNCAPIPNKLHHVVWLVACPQVLRLSKVVLGSKIRRGFRPRVFCKPGRQ